MTTGGAVLVMMSLFVGEFAHRLAGVSAAVRHPAQSGRGVDYYIWALQIAGWEHCCPA